MFIASIVWGYLARSILPPFIAVQVFSQSRDWSWKISFPHTDFPHSPTKKASSALGTVNASNANPEKIEVDKLTECKNEEICLPQCSVKQEGAVTPVLDPDPNISPKGISDSALESQYDISPPHASDSALESPRYKISSLHNAHTLCNDIGKESIKVKKKIKLGGEGERERGTCIFKSKSL